VDRSADPVCQKCTDPHGCAGRGDRGEHQGVGLDEPGAGGRGWRADRGPREDTRRPAARHRRDPRDADKVERWSIDRLIPYAKNARTHTDAQVAAIAASIKEWGWTTPALVGEDGMVEGGTPWGLPRLQPERQG